MQVSSVSNEDGRACAQLITFLKNARWELTGADVDELVKAKRWLQELAGLMANNLKAAQQPITAPDAPMKIKAMGPIGTRKKKK